MLIFSVLIKKSFDALFGINPGFRSKCTLCACGLCWRVLRTLVGGLDSLVSSQLGSYFHCIPVLIGQSFWVDVIHLPRGCLMDVFQFPISPLEVVSFLFISLSYPFICSLFVLSMHPFLVVVVSMSVGAISAPPVSMWKLLSACRWCRILLVYRMKW